MNWLILAILAPVLWAITSFIDKFLVSKYFKSSVGTLIVYSCLIGLPAAFLIAIFKPSVLILNWKIASLIVFNSFLFILYLFPYFRALRKADTSVVVTLFQTIPVFSFILAFFILGETLTNFQIVGSALIILGAIGISLSFHKGKFHLTKEVLFLQLLASFLISLNYILFKLFALDTDFWTTSFWQYLGFFIFGLILLICFKSYRKDFVESFRKNKESIILLNVLNEVINIFAIVIVTFVSLSAPVAVVSSIMNGFQPLCAFIIGIILSILFPKIIKENLSKKVLVQKIIFILLVFLGVYLLSLV